jgi:alkanesulfonate monooxygenase SsuD/methylene tetrahydromethanopterin reductase-like flavin-dependent oxidoreductase (luciferase family)
VLAVVFLTLQCIRVVRNKDETDIMEIGISMFGDLAFNNATRSFQSPQERLQDMLEEVKLADEVGLDVFGIGEHHRPDFAVSTPEIILAAAASVTKNIKLTSSVTVLRRY